MSDPQPIEKCETCGRKVIDLGVIKEPKRVEPERIIIEFGGGRTVILGGTIDGAPSMGLKIITHGFPVGEQIPHNIDMSLSKPEVGLRFLTKEGLDVFRHALERLAERFDQLIDNPKHTMEYKVWIQVEETHETGI